MTVTHCRVTKRFQKEYSNLPPDIRATVDIRLQQLFGDARRGDVHLKVVKEGGPPESAICWAAVGHGAYRLTMLIESTTARLRRVASRDEIDLAP
jgi:hypothetical protein